MVKEPLTELKLDFGTAIKLVIGGDDAVEVADVILNPSEDGAQGLKTLTHDLELKSHILNC